MRRRILVSLLAVVTLAVVALFVPAAVAIRGGIRRGDLLDVQRDASVVASQLPAGGEIDIDQLQQLVGIDRQVGLYRADGMLVDGVGPRQPDDLVRLGLQGVLAEGYVERDLVAAVPVRIGENGPAFVVRIREPPSLSQGRVVRALVLLAMGGLAILNAAYVVGLRLSRRISQPIEDLRSWADDTGPGKERVTPATSGMAELDGLRSTLLAGRARIEELLERERSFSNQVSHQLRTPVTALRVALETELEAPRVDRTRILHEGLGALDRLESTIRSLLTLARSDVDPGPVQLSEVVDDRTTWWSPTFARHGRHVGTEGDPAVANVDETALHHILDVLLENALDHGQGDVVIDVRCHRDSVTIDVSDQGPPPFDTDPFAERGRDTGHGIGLRLARMLTESTGGQLTLLETSNTTFRLSLAPSFT